MLKENLVILRNIHGYSQEEIAEKINISRQAYAKWETGATVPDIEKCSLLAAVYGVTIDSLIKTETAGHRRDTARAEGQEHLGLRHGERPRADRHPQGRAGQVRTHRRHAPYRSQRRVGHSAHPGGELRAQYENGDGIRFDAE